MRPRKRFVPSADAAGQLHGDLVDQRLNFGVDRLATGQRIDHRLDIEVTIRRKSAGGRWRVNRDHQFLKPQIGMNPLAGGLKVVVAFAMRRAHPVRIAMAALQRQAQRHGPRVGRLENAASVVSTA